MNTKLKVGVLALQGAVEPHRPHIEAAGAQFRAVKTAQQFDEVDAFILPGGESTTMLKLIENFGLWESLVRNFAVKPVWGICAGCILIAERVLVSSRAKPRDLPLALREIPPLGQGLGRDDTKGDRDDDGWETQKSFALLPMTVQRNAYGRQLDSHQAEIAGYPVSFIRAPVIMQADKDIEILAVHQNSPVWLRKGRYMATTFHPELTLDFPSPMHAYFARIVHEAKREKAV